MSHVFDASAVLAILFKERGGDFAADRARGSLLSAVNLIEVLEKFAREFGSSAAVPGQIARLELLVIPFGATEARIAADFKARPDFRNVSLADRSCLAAGIVHQRPIITADTKWSDLDLDIDIVQIR